MNEKMNDEDIFEIENSIIIHIPSDIIKITEGVRESFSYLEGLVNLDSVYRGLNQKESLDISEKSKEFKIELQNLENKVYFTDKENGLATFSDYDELKNFNTVLNKNY